MHDVNTGGGGASKKKKRISIFAKFVNVPEKSLVSPNVLMSQMVPTSLYRKVS